MSYNPAPPEMRFREKVNEYGPKIHSKSKRAKKRLKLWPEIKGTRCREYTGYMNEQGYGRFWDGNKLVYAHRFAWIAKYGEKELLANINLQVLHKCDNSACVYWLHLFLGTNKKNVEDKIKKGRARYPGYEKGKYKGILCVGEKNGNARLSKEDVNYIRKHYSLIKRNGGKLGRKFGVSNQQIFRIAKGKSWSHL